jgi:hypothetical protein
MFNEELVHVTPQPIFAGLETLDDWVLCLMKMFGRMAIRRIVATAHMTACQTKSEVHPIGPDGKTFLATIGSLRLNSPDFSDVFAWFGHVCSVTQLRSAGSGCPAGMNCNATPLLQ